jgi:hypothetical protein
MIQGSVDEQIRGSTAGGAGIPRTGLDTDIVRNAAELFKLSVGDDNSIFADKGDLRSIRRPDDGLDLGSGEFSQNTSGLDFEENGTIVSSQNDTSRGTTIKECIDIRHGGLNALGSLVVQVLHNDLSLMSIQDSKPTASQEDSRSHAATAFAICDAAATTVR